LVNEALRTVEVDLIIKMGFRIRDLYQDIAKLHLEQYGERSSFRFVHRVRGQGLSQTDFDQLMKTKGGLLSFKELKSCFCLKSI
jgi:hypothetical protein